MDNFYQSTIWRTINTSIFQKPVFEINLFWSKYFWTIKTKKRFWFTAHWYQVMWIESWFPSEHSFSSLKDSLYNIGRDYWNDFWNIMFQFWFVDELQRFPVSNLKSDEFINTIKHQRETNNDYMNRTFGLCTSFRENMPLSTIIFDLSLWYDNLFQSMSKSARAHINKWNTRNLVFTLARNNQERDEFYQIWHETSTDKGFNIFSKSSFDSLRNFLNPKSTGNLFLAKLNWQIVSWSICFFVWKTIVYMYGATNRKFWNVWWHHFLKNEMFKWWIENWFKTVDLLWTSPTWYPEHHLCWVSKFKESLWGTKIEYYWNFDYILNNNLYKVFKYLKS